MENVEQHEKCVRREEEKAKQVKEKEKEHKEQQEEGKSHAKWETSTGSALKQATQQATLPAGVCVCVCKQCNMNTKKRWLNQSTL